MKSYNVLIVEDEKEIADAIEIYLKNQYLMIRSWRWVFGPRVI